MQIQQNVAGLIDLNHHPIRQCIIFFVSTTIPITELYSYSLTLQINAAQ